MGRWPKVVKACVDGGANLALGSMGAAIFYLQRSLVDYEIISMAEVRAYVPPMTTNAKVENTQNNEGNSTLSQMSEEVRNLPRLLLLRSSSDLCSSPESNPVFTLVHSSSPSSTG
jgi:hypothetical protein